MRWSWRCPTTGCRTSNGPANAWAARWRRMSRTTIGRHYLRISISSTSHSGGVSSRFVGMLDAFGGCCVYDESALHDAGGRGVLGWLIAGADALSLCNSGDQALIARALESLPDELYDAACRGLIEGKVHRWAGALSGQPGGFPLRDPWSAHRPEPIEHAGLVVVGDYLFDSTLNGVLRSAHIASELIATGCERRDAGRPRLNRCPTYRDLSARLCPVERGPVRRSKVDNRSAPFIIGVHPFAALNSSAGARGI